MPLYAIEVIFDDALDELNKYPDFVHLSTNRCIIDAPSNEYAQTAVMKKYPSLAKFFVDYKLLGKQHEEKYLMIVSVNDGIANMVVPQPIKHTIPEQHYLNHEYYDTCFIIDSDKVLMYVNHHNTIIFPYVSTYNRELRRLEPITEHATEIYVNAAFAPDEFMVIQVANRQLPDLNTLVFTLTEKPSQLRPGDRFIWLPIEQVFESDFCDRTGCMADLIMYWNFYHRETHTKPAARA